MNLLLRITLLFIGTISKILVEMGQGVIDGISVLSMRHAFQNSIVKENMVSCFLLNGIFFVGIDIICKRILLPFTSMILWAKDVHGASIYCSHSMMGLWTCTGLMHVYQILVISIFYMIWLIPVYILNILFCGKWYNDICKESYSVYWNQDEKPKQQKEKGFSLIVQSSKSIYSMVLVSCGLLAQGFVLELLPTPFNHIFGIINVSFITSWSAFDLKWSRKGWTFEEKEEYFEQYKWYFAGFGLVPSMLVFWSGNFPVNSGVWSVLFPFSIIAATYSTPKQGSRKHIKTHLFRILRLPKLFTNYMILVIQSVIRY